MQISITGEQVVATDVAYVGNIRAASLALGCTNILYR